MVKSVSLTLDDMELMTIGMILDYIEEYIDQKNPKKKRTRKANQKDFDKF